MKRLLIWSLAIVFVLTMATIGIGCKQTEVTEETAEEVEEAEEVSEEEVVQEESFSFNLEKKDYGYKIGHLMYAENFPASQSQLSGFKRVSEEYGCELVTADINADWAKVPEQVDYLLTQEIDGLCDASWGADAGVITAQKCEEQGIPIVTSDVVFDYDYDWNFAVGADNYEAGQVNGVAIYDFINEEWGGEYDYICGIYPFTAGEVVKGRLTGAFDKMKELGMEVPDEKVGIFDQEGKEDTVRRIIMDSLTAHPDSDKILIIVNTDGFLPAGMSAVETMGREDDVAYFSYDGDANALEVLNTTPEGHFFKGTVSFQLDRYADLAIPMVLTCLEDPEAAKDIPKWLSPELVHVNRENVQEFIK